MQNIVVLSEGCQPTEDIYLMQSVATHLTSRKSFNFRFIKCKNRNPNTYASTFSSNDSVFVVFRTLPPTWIQYLQNHKASNSLIYVLDDDLRAASLSPQLPEKYRTRLGSFANNYLAQLLDMSDTLVVTSTHLMESYKSHNPVRLNPTALNLPKHPSNFSQQSLSIAYHATSSHKVDLEHIQGPLIKTLDTYACTFESLIGKQTPEKLLEHSSTKCKSPKSYSSFRRFQALATRNICLAPLFDTPYNQGKSWIKFLDTASVGAVGIYSNRPPYTEIVTHGVNGMLASDDVKDWEDCLSYLIENPKKAQIMADNALQTARIVGNYRRSYKFWSKLFRQYL